MSSVFKVESTLTVRYQATVPDAVQRALQLDKRDASEGDQPAMRAFLDFLAHDIAAHPERLATMPPALTKRMKKLTTRVEFNLTEALDRVPT
jgi:antitoxin PrlF